jgi:hypothetical protein
MATNFAIYWYRESAFVKNAFLYNCRDNDLKRVQNCSIREGQIVKGAVGYVIAEHHALGFRGEIVRFKPNRKCHWQGLDLPCMAHDAIPGGTITKDALRHYQYAVAQLPDEQAVKIAVKKGIPVIVTLNRQYFLNLELSTFEKQGKASTRRAKLI